MVIVAAVNRLSWDVRLFKLYMHVGVKSELCIGIILNDGHFTDTC